MNGVRSMPSEGNQTAPDPSKGHEPTVDDRELARRARVGDHAAYAQLVAQYSDRLHSMLLHLVNGDRDLAAEFTQEAFVRAYDRLDQFEGASSFYTWLYRLARNRAIDLLERKRPTATANEHLDQAGSTASPLEEVAGEDMRQHVQRALARLPTATRELLLLREFDGLDYDEIATALGVPLGTVKSRLNRARADLRALLSGSVTAEDVA
ncbi:MAG: sigma-70 family RNA polymerase sigma factor [Planctomycetes bacterium]|nr:sigma-70 family RNA polymerase sigma factor [Planctomycetota bacterium]